LPEETDRPDHYGLIIMRDRAKSLHGRCEILPRSGGGTEVRVVFKPDNHGHRLMGETMTTENCRHYFTD